MEAELTSDPDGKPRCPWHGGHPDYIAYHDDEWGRPEDDEHRLFEKICLEGFQAGLSWLTILRKREHFREAFEGFDFERIAQFTPRHVERFLGNEKIVRHRGKIGSVINNAKQARRLRDEFGSLGAYFWAYEPGEEQRREEAGGTPPLGKTPASMALSKDLKKRGWTYVGPVTMAAFMQAMGMVNDHLMGCHVRPAVEKARRRFRRPK